MITAVFVVADRISRVLEQYGCASHG